MRGKPLSFLHETMEQEMQASCAYTLLSPDSSRLIIVLDGAHAFFVSEVTQTAQYSGVCVAHKCDVAEPFAQWIQLEGQVFVVRGLVTR